MEEWSIDTTKKEGKRKSRKQENRYQELQNKEFMTIVLPCECVKD